MQFSKQADVVEVKKCLLQDRRRQKQTRYENNQFMSPFMRHTMIIGTHRPGVRVVGIFLFPCQAS